VPGPSLRKGAEGTASRVHITLGLVEGGLEVDPEAGWRAFSKVGGGGMSEQGGSPKRVPNSDPLEAIAEGGAEELEASLKNTPNAKAKLRARRKSDGLTAACVFVNRRGAPAGLLDTLVKAGACFKTASQTKVTPLMFLMMTVGDDEDASDEGGEGEDNDEGLGERTSLLKQLLDLDASGAINLGIESHEAGDNMTALHYAAMVPLALPFPVCCMAEPLV